MPMAPALVPFFCYHSDRFYRGQVDNWLYKSIEKYPISAMVWNTIQRRNQGSWYTCSISPRYSERKKFNAQHFVLENTQLPTGQWATCLRTLETTHTCLYSSSFHHYINIFGSSTPWPRWLTGLSTACVNGTRDTTPVARLALQKRQLDSGKFYVGPGWRNTNGTGWPGGLSARKATIQKADGDNDKTRSGI